MKLQEQSRPKGIAAIPGHASASLSQEGQAASLHLAHSSKPVIPRDKLIRLEQCEEITGIKKSYIYLLIRQGRFPTPIRISSRCSVWPESRVLAWVQEQINGEGAA